MNNKLTAHLLPISEASNLAIAPSGKLDFNPTTLISKMDWINQHLYLTDSSEIKEGYVLVENGNSFLVGKIIQNFDTVIEVDIGWSTTQTKSKSVCKKIIFTTYPKLISDGVTAIDGNTKTIIRAMKYMMIQCVKVKFEEVNFLEEFCNRYNSKDNRKKLTCRL